MNTALLYIFVIANIGIFCGYAFLALAVVPKAAARLRRTKVGGIIFFFTCGLTHLELAYHALTPQGLDLDELLSWHMFIIHTVQLVAVWSFVTGLYIEFVRWGPWRAAHEHDGSSVHVGRLLGADSASDLPGVGGDGSIPASDSPNEPPNSTPTGPLP